MWMFPHNFLSLINVVWRGKYKNGFGKHALILKQKKKYLKSAYLQLGHNSCFSLKNITDKCRFCVLIFFSLFAAKIIIELRVLE